MTHDTIAIKRLTIRQCSCLTCSYFVCEIHNLWFFINT